MLAPVLTKNDKQARILISVVSFVVFAAVVVLGKIKLDINLGFDTHLFAKINAVINSTVAVLLVAALIAIRADYLGRKFFGNGRYQLAIQHYSTAIWFKGTNPDYYSNRSAAYQKVGFSKRAAADARKVSITST